MPDPTLRGSSPGAGLADAATTDSATPTRTSTDAPPELASSPLPTPAQQLGMRLRQARVQKHLTQSEVAQKQFSVSYISAVERGQIRPSLGALERLSERLEVPLADLLQDRDSGSRGFSDRSRDSSAGSFGSVGGFGSAGDRQREEIESRLREGLLLSSMGQASEGIVVLQTLIGRTLSLHDQVILRWRLADGFLLVERGEDARREAQEGLVLAERAGDVELREQVREALGRALVQLRRYQLALDSFRACEDAIQQQLIREPVFELKVLSDLGTVYWSLGDAATAITYLARAADLAEAVTRPAQLARLYHGLSATYASQNDSTRARTYAHRSLAAFEEAGHLQLTGQVYTRLGQAQAQRGQTAEALSALRTALDLAEEQHDLRGIAEGERSLAAIYVAQQQIDEAARAIAIALDRSAEINDPIQQGESLLALAQIQEMRKAHPEAEQSYAQALELLGGPNAAQHLGDAYAQFSAFLERRGQSKRALELLRNAWRLRDGAAVN